MTTDSQPSEQPESTAKFGYGRFVRVGPVRLFTPAEREELDRNPPSFAQAARRRAQGSATD